ncbi:MULTISPECIES: branched-chain amino acid ABC transporter permease [unclassified Haladaptatus]|uniref:branched-chain amino acid ABC transporter permease n=1 Tax=unclassified Haladaptatus TaxID=2622732 RepID=UPI002FCE2AFE
MALASDLTIALINGLSWGITIALIALGLNLIFGLLEIVNMAHGSLYMLGAVTGWFVVDATGSFFLALLIAPIAVAVIGVVLERVVLRPIEDDISITLIATFGFLLIFQQLALLTFGPGTRTIEAPITATLQFAGLSYSAYRIVVAVVSVLLIALLYAFLFRTRMGMWMRGVRQDLETASALGVPTSQVYMLTFGLGAAFAALAGVLLAPIVSVNHLMGLDILAVAFIVVIVGGLGSLQGVLVASLLYAFLENFGAVFIAPVEARILTLVIMIVFVLLRPDGVFEEGAI